MAEAINMIDLVRNVQKRDRGRACIVMTEDYLGQKEWANKLARQTDAQHINLLDLFDADKDLSDKLQEYSVERLFSLLTEKAEKDVLVVSGIEFMKASWSGIQNALEQFTSRVETWEKKDNPALIFVMQYDKSIAEKPFRRFRQYKFVVDQRDTLAL
jgi:hypothetical protein